MEHIAAFMLLIGCSGDAQACREIPVPVAAYEDVAECRKELQLQIRLNEMSADRIYGACQDVDEETFAQSGTIDWSIDRNGRLDIRFEPAPQIVAAR